MFPGLSPRAVGVWNCAGVIDDNVRPEFLEDFVRPTPKQNCIEIGDVFRSRFGLFL
jgi:hypothetical protein